MAQALGTRARVMAVDLGRRRIGLAITDSTGAVVTPLDTIERRDRASNLARLGSIARDRKASGFVVGLPLHMSGDESPMSAEARAFAARLAEATSLPVVMHDERLTSVEAEELLRRKGWTLEKMLKEKRKGAVDRLAAAVLLEDWLSSRPPDEEAS